MTEETLQNPRVLIFDDDPTIRLLAGEALESEGFVVETAEDGRHAVRIFQEFQPDVVLLTS